MGQKVNSNSLRFGINKNWVSRWNSRSYVREKNFKFLIEHEAIWLLLKNECAEAGLGYIEMERFLYSEDKEAFHVYLHVAQPGFLLSNEKLFNSLVKKVQRIVGKKILVQLKVLMLRNPNVSAPIVLQEISTAFKNRVSHVFIVKKLMKRTMISGALGIKVKISGRINGVEIARSETYTEGSVPLSTLRADIDYCFDYVKTKYGVIGIKVWIHRGLYFGKHFMPLPDLPKNKLREKDQYIAATY